jgi:hypothetical protein
MHKLNDAWAQRDNQREISPPQQNKNKIQPTHPTHPPIHPSIHSWWTTLNKISFTHELGTPIYNEQLKELTISEKECFEKWPQ